MRRTQLYLEEDLWKALHVQAGHLGVTISELVRQAVRDRYLSSASRRGQAMEDVIGLWKDRDDLPRTEKYVRELRRGNRRKRLIEP